MPKISQLKTVHEVLQAHADRMRPIDMSACWNTLAKQVKRPRERSWIRGELQSRPVLQPLLDTTLKMLRRSDARVIANTAHGLATVVDRTGLETGAALWTMVSNEAVGRLGEFNSQNLCNTAWAFATVGHASPALFDGVAKVAVGRLGEFNTQDLSNTAWAFARVGHASPALFDGVARAAVGRLGEFNSQNLSNTAWAFATVGHAPPALFDGVARAAVGRLGEFNSQELSNTAWAFATVGHASPVLFDGVARAAVGRLGEFNAQNLSNTAWALAAADIPSACLFGDERFLERCAAVDLDTEALCQLHQWQLWLEERGESYPQLPAPLARRCREAFVAEEGRPSKLQKQVTRALAALGLEPREEVQTPQGYSLDAVVRIDGHDIAVEVDGPFHFLSGMHTQTPSGATMLKRRQLAASGWPLLPVPYWEWNKIDRNEVAQGEYLINGLRAAVEGHGVKACARAAGAPVAGPLSWNDFQASVKGQGLPREEVRSRYREQRARGMARGG